VRPIASPGHLFSARAQKRKTRCLGGPPARRDVFVNVRVPVKHNLRLLAPSGNWLPKDVWDRGGRQQCRVLCSSSPPPRRLERCRCLTHVTTVTACGMKQVEELPVPENMMWTRSHLVHKVSPGPKLPDVTASQTV
jgi:hypothetical protein